MDAPTDVATKTQKFPAWAAALTDRNVFEQEQAHLGKIWTFLGLTLDLAKDGDWFTAQLGGRSVFVQRFGERLKGFENRCAHRFYPIRTAKKGNGPIQCGFHQWMYNQEGRAVGIPRCKELFGVTPRELDARIAPVEIATCGSLVFGRFPHPRETESLHAFLGEAVPIIEAMCTLKQPPRPVTLTVKANWKLCYHISLDDYHSPAIHPTTFGKGGYLKREALRYFRFGSHNAFFPGATENALREMIEACKHGSFRPVRYRIFQFFPNLLIALFHAKQFWYVNVQQYVPVAPDRSFMRSWYYRAPFATGKGPLGQWLDDVSEPGRAQVIKYFIRKLHAEDNAVVERLQSVANQLGGWPRVGYAEERIKWFEEAYAQAMAD
jgi:phenylpropionate dioxygenase-like ring-hydroxylating dioxygenase large terminal subunit